MKLGKRLTGVANMVTPVETLADIGCDHGLLSIRLIEDGKCRSVIASDVNKGPILRAKENIKAAHLEDRIETRISNGFEKLAPGEADAFIIAGMGGLLGLSILLKAKEQVEAAEYFIFQVQSELELVRYCFREWGFRITQEQFIKERNAYYFIMRVIPADGIPALKTQDEAEGYFKLKRNEIYKMPVKEAGPFFYPKTIVDPYGTYPEYLERERNRLKEIFIKLTESGRSPDLEAGRQIEAELKMLEEIRNEMW